MSTGMIVAIAIVIISILALIIVGIITYKNTKPTLTKMKETNETVSEKMDLYNREINHVTERVDQLNERVKLAQQDAEVKMAHFQDFTDEQGQFQTSINYLKDHAGDYASGIGSNLKDEWKEDGPKLKETFKRAFKKTAQKQKVRYKN